MSSDTQSRGAGAGRRGQTGETAGSGSSGGRGRQPASLEVREEKGWRVARLTGAWTTAGLGKTGRELEQAASTASQGLRIDLGEVAGLDSAGALVINQALKVAERRDVKTEIAGADESRRDFIAAIGEHDVPAPPPERSDDPLTAVLLETGRSSFYIWGEAKGMLSFLGYTVIVFFRTLLHPRRLRFTAMVSHMEHAGLNAMPIVGLMSFLIGVVLAYQGADQLARFGAQIFTVNLVGIGILREMGIILTAIIVAGRSGSAFAAQIGTMKVNEEVDALRAIGLDPMDVLVMPRIFALVLVMPLLAFYADIMGLLGGMVMAAFVLDISFERFINQLQDAVPLWSFWVGIIKAPIFAFIIAMIGCFEGFKVGHSAESVGQRTTAAVVESIFLVIVLDALFSIFFSYIGV